MTEIFEEVGIKPEIYKTIVRIRKDSNKKMHPSLTPLWIWVLLSFISVMMVTRVTYFAVIPMFLVFLSIIPIFCFLMKKKKEIQANAFISREVTFHVKGNELFVDDIKLNVSKDVLEKEIYVDDIRFAHVRKCGTVPVATFIGAVEEPYVDGFLEFLLENDVKIDSV